HAHERSVSGGNGIDRGSHAAPGLRELVDVDGPVLGNDDDNGTHARDDIDLDDLEIRVDLEEVELDVRHRRLHADERRYRPLRPPDLRLPAGPDDERVEAVPAGDRTCAPIDGRDRRGGAEPVRGQLGDEIGQHLVEIDGELRGLDPVHPFVEFGNCDPTVAGGLAQNFDGIVTLLVTDAEGLRGVLVVGTGAG